MNNTLSILVAVVLVALAAYQIYRMRQPLKDVQVPRTATRTDLLYGFYGCMKNQVDETKGCTNLLWESQFEGLDQTVANVLKAAKPTILDISRQLFIDRNPGSPDGPSYAISPGRETNLRGLFDFLQGKDALKYIVGLYPMDEPGAHGETVEDMQAAIDSIRKVTADYPELATVKLAVIYAAKPAAYMCIEQFDWIGLDDYDMKSTILVNGTYSGMLGKLKPGAKTLLVPGGSFGQDITPFLNFAHSNPEVAAVIPFTWLEAGPTDTWVGIGNDKNPLKQMYMDAGASLLG